MTPQRWCQTRPYRGSILILLKTWLNIGRASQKLNKSKGKLRNHWMWVAAVGHSAYVASKMFKSYTSFTPGPMRECEITKMQWFYQTPPAFKNHTETYWLDLLPTIKKSCSSRREPAGITRITDVCGFNDPLRNPLDLRRPQQFWMIGPSMMTADGLQFCTIL